MEAINHNCGQCGQSDRVTERVTRQDVPVGERGIVLCVFGPVMSCGRCAFEWTDRRSEVLRDEMAQRYLAIEHALAAKDQQIAKLLAESHADFESTEKQLAAKEAELDTYKQHSKNPYIADFIKERDTLHAQLARVREFAVLFLRFKGWANSSPIDYNFHLFLEAVFGKQPSAATDEYDSAKEQSEKLLQAATIQPSRGEQG